MTRIFARFSLATTAAACLFLAGCDDGAITARSAAAYATASEGRNGAIFLTLHNASGTDDRLIAARTDKAATVEIHESSVDKTTGMMQMRKVDAIDVKAGADANLAPGGYHIMLLGLNAPLIEGETFDLTLDFDKTADLPVKVKIIAPGTYKDHHDTAK